MTLSIIKQPPALILAKQPVSFTVQSDETTMPIRIKACISGSADEDSVAADGSKQASFELSDYLQGLITERYKTAATPVVYTNNPFPVQVEFHSLLGSPPAAGSELVSGVFNLLDGYVPKPRRKALYADYSSLQAYLQDKRTCLSWWPYAEAKKIQEDQKEFINFMQVFDLENPCSLSMTVVILCDDGSTETMEAKFTVASVDPFETVYFPCGYEQLGMYDFLYDINRADDTWKWAKSYTVYVFNSALDLSSQSYTFELDTTYSENPRQLYIRNPFGLLERVRCTGQGEQHNDLKFEMVRTDGRILPDRLNWKYDKSNIVKANTGFLTKAQMQWLSDMDFLEAYELINDVLIPIVFRDLSLPIIHDSVYQYSADLEYEYAYSETNETDEITS
jgi:hypothetical protein